MAGFKFSSPSHGRQDNVPLWRIRVCYKPVGSIWYICPSPSSLIHVPWLLMTRVPFQNEDNRSRNSDFHDEYKTATRPSCLYHWNSYTQKWRSFLASPAIESPQTWYESSVFHRRHDMEMFPHLLALCEGNPSIHRIPNKGSVTQRCDFSFVLAVTICWTNSGVVSDLKCYDAHVT